MPISASNSALKNAELLICGDIAIDDDGKTSMAGNGNYGGYAKTIQDKGTELINDLNAILSTFSGNTKQVVLEKIGTSTAQGTPEEGKLAYILCTTLPEMVKQLAIIIEVNRNLIEKYDTGLAKALKENGNK